MRTTITIIVLLCLCILSGASFTSRTINTKEDLGRKLFFDPILSEDSTISCASCHRPEFAFADTARVSVGVHGRKGKRNSPSAMNLLIQEKFFWDGRADSLEQQALAPIENPDEMNLSLDEALRRLNNSKDYTQLFQRFYQSGATRASLANALASFERTLETGESPFDEWKITDDSSLVSSAAMRGFEIFGTKGKCTSCHFGSNFTRNDFRNIGLFNGADLNDSGRAVITGNPADIGRFKTPGLRNVALTAPYMHNGIFRTLKEVIQFYNDPGEIVPDAICRDSVLAKPLGLTEQDMADLEAFLLSVTDKQFTNITAKSNR